MRHGLLDMRSHFVVVVVERPLFPKPFCDLSLATMIIIDRSQ